MSKFWERRKEGVFPKFKNSKKYGKRELSYISN
jgi:predicted Rdx family selenoprotein